MKTVRMFDPPMCCPTGVCGTDVDPELARVAADLAWLVRAGARVERHNLAQEPAAFASEPAVLAALREDPRALPLLLVDGAVVCRGRYPTRGELAAWAGVEPESFREDPLPMFRTGSR